MSSLKELEKGKGRFSCGGNEVQIRSKFLAPHYLQDNFTRLHHIRQEAISVEEYTRDFERLLMTYDLRESEGQTMVRYLRGLNESI